MTIKIDNEEVTNVLFVATSLMSNLNSLASKRYSCVSCSIDDSSATKGKRYNFDFKSEKVKRIITISYSPPTSSSTLHCFNVSIETDEDILYLEDFINEHKLYNDIDYLDLDTYEGNTKQKIEKFIEFLDRVFSEEFHDIISGKKWEHIGFDWQGYK